MAATRAENVEATSAALETPVEPGSDPTDDAEGPTAPNPEFRRPYRLKSRHTPVDRSVAQRANKRLLGAGIGLTIAGAATFGSLCSDVDGWLCALGGLPGGLSGIFAGVPMIVVASVRKKALSLAPDRGGLADRGAVADPRTPAGEAYTKFLLRAGGWTTGAGALVLAGAITSFAFVSGPDGYEHGALLGGMYGATAGGIAFVTGSGLLLAGGARRLEVNPPRPLTLRRAGFATAGAGAVASIVGAGLLAAPERTDLELPGIILLGVGLPVLVGGSIAGFVGAYRVHHGQPRLVWTGTGFQF